jgi:hypothetical protein
MLIGFARFWQRSWNRHGSSRKRRLHRTEGRHLRRRLVGCTKSPRAVPQPASASRRFAHAVGLAKGLTPRRDPLLRAVATAVGISAFRVLARDSAGAWHEPDGVRKIARTPREVLVGCAKSLCDFAHAVGLANGFTPPGDPLLRPVATAVGISAFRVWARDIVVAWHETWRVRKIARTPRDFAHPTMLDPGGAWPHLLLKRLARIDSCGLASLISPPWLAPLASIVESYCCRSRR